MVYGLSKHAGNKPALNESLYTPVCNEIHSEQQRTKKGPVFSGPYQTLKNLPIKHHFDLNSKRRLKLCF
jgi:hypothetical protein